jgi:hypothetical protein
VLSPEFDEFYKSWLEKAEQYHGDDLRDYFDKFFTLYILYNRLYAEATFDLARNGKIDLSKRTSFPDSKAAKEYVLQFLGSDKLLSVLEGDLESKRAMETFVSLIEKDRFNIKLDMVYGRPQKDKDLELMKSLGSRSSNKRARAVLDTIYSIRCNMFHSHKGFHQIQIEILRPVTLILRKVVELLYRELSSS